MSTPIGQRVLNGFAGGQIFVEGDALEVSAAINGTTMAVADVFRAIEQEAWTR
ncbi:hypothetical protein PQR71_12120 [Paraburkholderia fungorum]|uniref:hypothetical protein n=1 Tax=Paraburkholderia fungorum TaxID=134537 RepID=UPI0038BD235A